MPRARSGTRRIASAVVAAALVAAGLDACCRPAAFAPLRAAALAGALLAGSPSYADTAPMAYGVDASSVQLAAKSINLGGQAQDGGLDGTYEQKVKANRKDMIDDDKALAQEEKFEQKFDQYIGVFGILFVGAFIAPMVTYFWYVRDSDPFEN
mmetsp:Transcript_65681/g.148204  ORF Transcript_65681/g.148204 Transcript_65681/m.148204 type:complete len:153 (-) Transcript_65681:107-565(-)